MLKTLSFALFFALISPAFSFACGDDDSAEGGHTCTHTKETCPHHAAMAKKKQNRKIAQLEENTAGEVEGQIQDEPNPTYKPAKKKK